MKEGGMFMRPIGAVITAAALALAQVQPAGAWVKSEETAGGGHYGAAASNGHWAAGANGHTASGTYGTTANGTHYATDAKGGTASASNGSWSSQSASGKTNSGSYGTTANGTHYATGSYGGAVATNNGHWAGESNGQYAYGTHYSGNTAYGGAYHPPAVVNQYYGTGCYNCGGWGGAGAVAAGVAVGAAAGVAVGAATANAANAQAAAAYAAAGYAPGDIYVALPAGCGYAPFNGNAYYNCGGTWFSPAYGANGLYYRVVPAP
jgi:hypothetical protein